MKLVSAAAVVAVAGTASAQLIIDDFTTDQFVTDNTIGSTFGFVNGPGILGGDRDVSVFDATLNVDGGTALLTPETSNGDSVEIVYDGPNGTPTDSFNDLSPLNLSALGDRFAFDVISVTGVPVLEALILASGDSVDFNRAFLPTPVEITATGAFEVPLSAVSGTINAFDITDVRFMAFRWRLDGGESLEIDNLRYVPTPATAALLGLAGLAATRRRR